MGETAARCFRPAPDVAARDISEGLMLVNLQTGAAFKLNQVGTAVWKRLDGTSDMATIVADLQRRYQVDRNTLLRDVEVLLSDLERQGLISS